MTGNLLAPAPTTWVLPHSPIRLLPAALLTASSNNALFVNAITTFDERVFLGPLASFPTQRPLLLQKRLRDRRSFQNRPRPLIRQRPPHLARGPGPRCPYPLRYCSFHHHEYRTALDGVPGRVLVV